MGKDYSHLTEDQRILLSMMLQKGYSKSKIADNLGVHRSTVYREVQRNSWKALVGQERYYTPMKACQKCLARRKRRIKLQFDTKLRLYVEEKLKLGWSPWQIEGRLKRENGGRNLISHETIYRYIYSDYGIRNRFYKKLRRKHFYRIKRGIRKARLPKDLMIDNRPDDINDRKTFGHWECDLMIFKNGIRGNLITLRERKTRFLIAIKNKDKTARGTAMTLINAVKDLKPQIHSVTFDQGGEFMKYNWIKECLETAIYFCKPASPHQKGGIENGNGVIRVELPREYDIGALRQSDLLGITNVINNRPLKCLSYQTPQEVFSAYISEKNGN